MWSLPADCISVIIMRCLLHFFGFYYFLLFILIHRPCGWSPRSFIGVSVGERAGNWLPECPQNGSTRWPTWTPCPSLRSPRPPTETTLPTAFTRFAETWHTECSVAEGVVYSRSSPQDDILQNRRMHTSPVVVNLLLTTGERARLKCSRFRLCVCRATLPTNVPMSWMSWCCAPPRTLRYADFSPFCSHNPLC